MPEKIIKDVSGPEEFSPPFFCTPLTGTDKKILLLNSASRNFDTGFVLGAAVRCKWGFPQVLACAPFMSDGTPFPTVFWLVCPYLDKRCAELETEHKIPVLEKELENNREAVEKWHKEYAELRKKLLSDSETKNIANCDAVMESFDKTGVGGINRLKKPCTAKCLHLQTATMLAWKHPAEAWLRMELGCTECPDSQCNCKLSAENILPE